MQTKQTKWTWETFPYENIQELNAALKKDPTLLNNVHIYKINLSGLVLENMSIDNALWEHTDGENMRFTNVIFKNSTFDDMGFLKSTLKNTRFEKCKFTGWLEVDDDQHHSRFTGSILEHVVFYKTAIEVSLLDRLGGESSVIFDSLDLYGKREKFGDPSGPCAVRSPLHLYIRNSSLEGFSLGRFNSPSSLLVEDSTFIHAGGGGDITYVRNSKAHYGSFGGKEGVYVVDSRLSGTIGGPGTNIAHNVEYLHRSEKFSDVGGRDIGDTYFTQGKNKTRVHMRENGGNGNLTLVNMDVPYLPLYESALSNVNLFNTTVHQVHWKKTKIDTLRVQNSIIKVHKENTTEESHVKNIYYNNSKLDGLVVEKDNIEETKEPMEIEVPAIPDFEALLYKYHPQLRNEK